LNQKKINDGDFLLLWEKYHSASRVAQATGLTVRHVFRLRKELERKMGVNLRADANIPSQRENFFYRNHMARSDLTLTSGTIFVASDCHYHPGVESTAHLAFVKLIKKYKPEIGSCFFRLHW
jgi:hypothetical protein